MTERRSTALRAICERRVSLRDVACAWLVAILIGVGTVGLSYGIHSARHRADATQVNAVHHSATSRTS